MAIARKFKSGLLVATAVTTGLAVAGRCATASAQAEAGAPAASGAGNGLEEIVVTARKREEKNQVVPVSVTAFTAATIESHTMQNLGDVALQTPSLVVQSSTYDVLDTYIGIRGQHSSDVILTETPSVGIYFDDVYESSSIGTQLSNLMDVGQIEVLKGPQGTLYGRNTTGGAVKISSKLPDFDSVNGELKVGFGNYGETEVAGTVNVPLSSTVALRVTAQRLAHDGYGYDTVHQRDLEDLDSKSVRATLRLDLADDLEVLLRADYNDARSAGIIANLAAVQPGFTLANLDAAVSLGKLSLPQAFHFFGVGGPVTAADVAGLNAGYNALVAQIHDKSYNEKYSDPEATRLRAGGTSANISYDITDDLNIKSISAYRYLMRFASADTDGSIFQIIDGPADVVNTDQVTEELQLSGIGLDSKLKWTAGYYFYHMAGTDNSPGEIEFAALPLGVSPANARIFVTDDSNAVYGQASYAFLDTLHFTAGLRWTTESTGLSSTSTADGICAFKSQISGGCYGKWGNSFRNISYTAGFDWNVTSDILAYAKTSRGFKAGAENQRGSVIGTPFGPEIVTDYEIGVKSEWLDHKLRINAAAYHSDYDGIQRDILALIDNQIVTVVRNAASATIDGVELEVTAKPVDGLTLQATSAYTHPQYVKYTDPATGQDLSGNKFLDTPAWQIGLSGTYTIPTSVGPLSTTLDYSYESTLYLYPESHSAYTGNSTTQSGYSLVNARISLDVPEIDGTAAFWIKNIFDQRYNTTGNDFTGGPGAVGYVLTYPGNPRTFGFEFTKRF